MALETASFITGLVITNPSANDQLAQADDHMRLIKAVLKSSFPNINAAMTATPTELNGIDGRVTTIEGGFMKLDGTTPMTADLDVGTHKIVGVVDPDADQDAATKKFVVDQIAAGAIADPMLLGTAQAYTKQKGFTLATLTPGASISWNLDNEQVAQVTLNTASTLQNPTNQIAGATYVIFVRQDGTGSRTLNYGSAFKWTGGVVPTLSTAINAVDVFAFISDGTTMHGGIFGLAFS